MQASEGMLAPAYPASLSTGAVPLARRLFCVARTQWVDLAVGAFAVVFALPLLRLPTDGLDPSWSLGLSWASELGLQFGPQIDFTYGPLGFAATPIPLGMWSLLAPLPINLIVLIVLAAVCRQLTSVARKPLSWCITIIVMQGLTLFDFSTAQMAAVALLGVWLVREDLSVRPRRELAGFVLIGAVGAIVFLTKTNIGMISLAVIAVAALACAPRLRRLAAGFGGFAGAVLILWLYAGQNPLNIPSWLITALEIVRGYGPAMGTDYSEITPLQVWTLIVAAAISCALAWRGCLGRPLPQRLGVLLIIGGTMAGVVISSVTRLDGTHLRFAAATVPPMVLVFTPLAAVAGTARDRVFTLSAAAIGTIGSLLILGMLPQHFGDSFASLSSQARYAVDQKARLSALEDSRAAIRETVMLSPDVVRALRGHTVHAEPWDIAEVWAYRLDWLPAPVFQTYTAYTPALDQKNAQAVLNGTPNGVLRTWKQSIDFRNTNWEAPDYQLALMCTFRSTASSGNVAALVKGSNICGEVIPISSATVRAGEKTPVPLRPYSIVLADIDADYHPGVLATIMPGREPLYAFCDSAQYRIGQGTPTGKLIMSMPGSVGWPPAADILPCGTVSVSTPATVHFYEVPVSAAGETAPKRQ